MLGRSTETLIKVVHTVEGHRAVIKQLNTPLSLFSNKYKAIIYLKGFKDRILCGWTDTNKEKIIKDCKDWTHKKELAQYIYPVITA